MKIPSMPSSCTRAACSGAIRRAIQQKFFAPDSFFWRAVLSVWRMEARLPGHFAGIVDLGRIGADGIGHDGGGHLFAVPVEDDPPVGLQQEGLGMLLFGEGLQCLAGEDLELKGARAEGDEKHQEEGQQGGNPEFHPFSGFAGHLSRITCSLSG